MTRRKILVTGANGQLGHSFQKMFALAENFEVTYASKALMDISQKETIANFIGKNHFDCIINCAAYTNVDNAEEHETLAFKINEIGTSLLAEYCCENNILLIHFSSDYVYDNSVRRPLVESDPTNPQSVYAKSKLAGESAILEKASHYLIFRTSWLYGTSGHNFVKTMHRLGKAGKKLQVVSDQVGAPTFTDDLATDVIKILSSTKELTNLGNGIFNYSHAGETNWYAYAKKIFELSCLTVDVQPTSTEDYGAPAPRPLYSVLSNQKLNKTFNIYPRNWQDALEDCMQQLGMLSI